MIFYPSSSRGRIDHQIQKDWVAPLPSIVSVCFCDHFLKFTTSMYTSNVANDPQNLRFFAPPSFLKIPSRDELSSFQKCRSSRQRIRSHEPEGVQKAPGVFCESIRFTKKNTKW